MLTVEQVRAYLSLLGCSDLALPERATLDTLILAHQTTIPFSSVDIYHSTTPPDLSVPAVFEKVVSRRRGGYCFELNLLFQKLLSSLGYNTRAVIGRVILGRPQQFPLNHRAMLVTFDRQDYYVDVGFGGPLAAKALLLQDQLNQVAWGEQYRTIRTGKASWQIARVLNGTDSNAPSSSKSTKHPTGPTDAIEPSLRTELEFYDIPVYDEDFVALNRDRSSPGSIFYEDRLLNLRTEDGFCALRNGVLTLCRNGSKDVRQLLAEEDIVQVIEHYFGLTP